MTEKSITDFGDFLAATRAARFDDYAARPGTRVEKVGEFTAMQRYILEHYEGVKVMKSLRVDGQIFDCLTRTERFVTFGEHDGTGCPPGSIPVRRITLDELTRYRSLPNFFRKDRSHPRPEG